MNVVNQILEHSVLANKQNLIQKYFHFSSERDICLVYDKLSWESMPHALRRMTGSKTRFNFLLGLCAWRTCASLFFVWFLTSISALRPKDQQQKIHFHFSFSVVRTNINQNLNILRVRTQMHMAKNVQQRIICWLNSAVFSLLPSADGTNWKRLRAQNTANSSREKSNGSERNKRFLLLPLFSGSMEQWKQKTVQFTDTSSSSH